MLATRSLYLPHFVVTMLSYVLICLTLCGLLSGGAFANNSQCTSLLLKNITDETQSSIVVMLLNSAKNVLEDAKKYASIETEYSSHADNSHCTSLILKNITDETQASVVKTLLSNAENLLDDAKKYASVKTSCPVVANVRDKPMDCPKVECDKQTDLSLLVHSMDCAEVMKKKPSANSGLYRIQPRNIDGPIVVYCDMKDDGGGWTVLQRRGDFGNEEDYFYKDWLYYKKGFGVLTKEFWLGNDNIFALTNQRSNIIKIQLTDWKYYSTYATYDEFWIDNEAQKYKLHVSGYRGTAGDALSYHNGEPFSTKDNDSSVSNCAVLKKGAWWYKNCYKSNLNGMYRRGSASAEDVNWYKNETVLFSLKDTTIKIRPKDFR